MKMYTLLGYNIVHNKVFFQKSFETMKLKVLKFKQKELHIVWATLRVCTLYVLMNSIFMRKYPNTRMCVKAK
jgi:hypothetical protein